MNGDRAWLFCLAIVVAVAAVIVVVLTVVPRSSSPPTTPDGPPPGRTFTWEGTTWDCGQVQAWDAQYGAYTPDGAPIPYEVVLSCDS